MRGEVLLAALRRSQLRLALSIGSVFVSTLAVIPLLYWGDNWLHALRIGAIPIIWLTLGVAVFPFIIGLGWLFIRVAEWYEQQFVDLVEDV